ncbi:hypothetical protein QBC47DRAFT_400532 [Echria macrotheca]|uniref:Uncharacterized protein n=1 Tax=Echria macrotheca TaxID=438768 RepID=A0AAJ0BF88_9PEZI|nr:hypothetical protein QBC47DRAFT_400532 [Echria macrotheca]
MARPPTPPGRPRPSQRMSSLFGIGSLGFGLRSTAPSQLDDLDPAFRHGARHWGGVGGENDYVPEARQIWHNPSLMQMVETLQAELMSKNNPLTPIPVVYNSYVLHLIEGFAKLYREEGKLRAELSELKGLREKELEEFRGLSEEWIQREKDYKAEVKRLELILARESKDGVASVALARHDSLVDRSESRKFEARLKRVSNSQDQESFDGAIPLEDTSAEDREQTQAAEAARLPQAVNADLMICNALERREIETKRLDIEQQRAFQAQQRLHGIGTQHGYRQVRGSQIRRRPLSRQSHGPRIHMTGPSQAQPIRRPSPDRAVSGLGARGNRSEMSRVPETTELTTGSPLTSGPGDSGVSRAAGVVEAGASSSRGTGNKPGYKDAGSGPGGPASSFVFLQTDADGAAEAHATTSKLPTDANHTDELDRRYSFVEGDDCAISVSSTAPGSSAPAIIVDYSSSSQLPDGQVPNTHSGNFNGSPVASNNSGVGAYSPGLSSKEKGAVQNLNPAESFISVSAVDTNNDLATPPPLPAKSAQRPVVQVRAFGEMGFSPLTSDSTATDNSALDGNKTAAKIPVEMADSGCHLSGVLTSEQEGSIAVSAERDAEPSSQDSLGAPSPEKASGDGKLSATRAPDSSARSAA